MEQLKKTGASGKVNKTFTGVLAIEDPYYLDKNIVPMNDKGIFRSFPLMDDDCPFLKPVVQKRRFDRYVSFLFDYGNVSGRIVYEKKDYSHVVSAFSIKFFPREDDFEEEEIDKACALLSQKLQAHIQVKISNKKLISIVKGFELKFKTPKKQDFGFQKLFEHSARTAEESMGKYIDDHFDFWFACGENEAAEYRAIQG